MYYTMLGQICVGQKLFTITSSELVGKYLDDQQDRVDVGFITQGRHTTIRTQLIHFFALVGAQRKLDTIKREKYKDYYLYRRKNHRKGQDVTLINEGSTLGPMYKFALEKGYNTQDRMPLWQELKRVNVSNRTSFTRN